jgi:hypothetical protein
MKPSEKRYFTLSSGIMTPAKKINYLKLFNAMDSMSKDDDEALIKKYRKESFINNLAANKNQLYEIILESLRNYNEETIEEWNIRKSLYKIEILANKGLDKECESQIRKTKEKAWRYEQYQVLLDIIELELYLFGNCRIGNFDPEIFKRIQNEKEEILQIINQYSDILATWHRLNLIFINRLNKPFEEVKAEAKTIIEKPFIQEEPCVARSLRSRNRYFACFELYYNAIGNAELCYLYNKKLIENRLLIDEKMPNFMPDAMAVYFNFMIACYNSNKYDEMEIYLNKTKEFPVSFIQQEIRRAHNYCYCGILLFLTTKNFDKAAEVVNDFMEAKEKYAGSYRLDFLLFTLCHCGWYYFSISEYDKAYSVWREISEGPKYSFEIRSLAITKCFLLIYYFTFRQFELLQNHIQSTRRYLKQNFILGENEANFLHTLSKCNGSNSDTKLLRQLNSKINQSDHRLSEKSIVNKFILDWLSEKVMA